MSEIKKVELAVPTGAELMGPAEAAYRDAVEVVIDCDEMRDVAIEERTAIRNRWNQLEEQRKTITKPLLEAKAAVDALFKPALDRLDAARQVLDKAVLTYTAEQERKAREEQARIEAAAAAERKRAEEAAAAAAENARKLAEQAAQAASAEEAAKLAEQAEQAQQEAAAQAVVAELVVAPSVQVEAKMAGASVRKSIDVEVVDIKALIKWVAENMDRAPNLVSLLVADSIKLKAFARTYGPDPHGSHQVPGVRIFEKSSLAASKRAA